MKRAHALAVSTMVGAAAVAGVVALGQTRALGQSAGTAGDTSLAERAAALDRAEAQIARLNANVPPALPTPPTAVTTRVVAAPAATAGFPSGESDDRWEGDDDAHEDDHDDEGYAESWDD